ncbi:MAG TPA: HD-GYP domain-containing protein, partial [Fusibacter sp.]|nr:HD-GYP domain-containing protein [Fusibacter sp.]
VKDIYTEGHARRVMDYSEKLSRTLNLPQNEIEKIKTAALLHDVGKIGIPNEILNKPITLDFDEYELVKKHPEDTKRILDKITGLSDVVTLAYMHHEHYDGSGYPQGLKGDQIPIGAHIIQLADAFDAMTSKRAYREAMPIEIAIEVLKSCSGTQFHPLVVEAAMNYYMARI